MKHVKWRHVGETLGIAAIVGSLVFVGLQMRQDHDIAIAQIWAMADQTQIELSNLVTENRDLWVKGLEGEELTHVDQVAFRSIVYTVFQRHANIVNRIERLDYGGTSEWRAKRLAFDLYRYPGLRQAFEEFRMRAHMRSAAFDQEVGGEFYAEVEKALAELDRDSPPVSDRLYVPL